MKLSTILNAAVMLLVSAASTAPLPAKRSSSDVPYYCDEYPEAFACSRFCHAVNWQYEYCYPEYCDTHPEHWSCKPKYIEPPPVASGSAQVDNSSV